MKILITGGAGYIGTELTHQLAKQDDVEEIVVYDNLCRKNFNLFIEGKLPENKVRFVEADILDTRRLKKNLDGIDIVYHLAAFVLTPFSSEHPHQFEQTNHWGTAELSYLLEKSSVSQVVYLSSASVYGLHNQLTNKREEPRPTSHYGISKLNGEKMIDRLKDQMDVHIIRSGNVYGYSRSMRFDSVINKFMFYAHHSGRISVNGKGSQKRAFIHVDQLSGFLSQLPKLNLPSGVLDLVNRNLSINEIVDALKNLYPVLEVLYISQDLHLNGMEITADTDLPEEYHQPETSFINELSEFKSAFSIS